MIHNLINIDKDLKNRFLKRKLLESRKYKLKQTIQKNHFKMINNLIKEEEVELFQI